VRRRSHRDVKRESTYEYFGRDDVVAEYASFDFVLWPEQRILDELRPRLATSTILDVGVGAGRTTLQLAPLVEGYVGIDTSEKMIKVCEERFGSDVDGGPRFSVADVRDLEGFEDETFDFVLFSFNGIDTVGDDADRASALGEIHRVTRSGGMFCFSSHNLTFARAGFSPTRSVLRLLATRPAVALRHPHEVSRVARAARAWGRLNRDRSSVARGRGLVVEERPRHEFTKEFYATDDVIRVEKYYIHPDEQRRELASAGFGAIRLFGPDGEEATETPVRRLSNVWWLYYLCEKVRGDPDGRP
jgi:ubiquinone/menaquinone biosynthesis C-methylase UbiE